MTLVPSPLKFPNGCIKCRSTRGPIYDGGVVTAMELTFYVCRTCAEVISSEYGLTDGAEMERLRHAAEELAQRDKEAAAHSQEMQHFAKNETEYKRQIILLRADLEAERGKVATMEHAADDMKRYAAQIGSAQTVAVLPDGTEEPQTVTYSHATSDPED